MTILDLTTYRPVEREALPPLVLCLGTFDGVHRGHGALLRTVSNTAKKLGVTAAVFTFDRSPKEAVSGHRVTLLTTVAERSAIIRIFRHTPTS